MFQAMNHACATPLPWRIVLPLRYENCAVAGAMFCYCGGRTLPLPSENCATATGELSRGNGRTLPPQSENFAPATAELSSVAKVAFIEPKKCKIR